jgi:hypothetical protein
MPDVYKMGPMIKALSDFIMNRSTKQGYN